MAQSTRRSFMLHIAAAGTALTAGAAAQSQPARIDENDPQAKALGYVHDTTKVDAKRFPRHTKDQKCTNCALFQGAATAAWGGCPLFGAKQVAGPGWCSAWAKKG
jgi:anaerobic selenocysteine-containing dehydrogenase